ncbi:MAG: hypothetical protein IKM61_08115 [Eubacteriaceae bacterium]|nr:hypothetical protein [Eubacteriaceae bacterium]
MKNRKTVSIILALLLMVSVLCSCEEKPTEVTGDMFFSGVKIGDNIFDIDEEVIRSGRYDELVVDEEIEKPVYGGSFDDPVKLSDGSVIYTSMHVRNDIVYVLDTEIEPANTPAEKKDELFKDYLKLFTDEFGLSEEPDAKYTDNDEVISLTQHHLRPADRGPIDQAYEITDEVYYLWHDDAGVYYAASDVTYHYPGIENSTSRRFMFSVMTDNMQE